MRPVEIYSNKLKKMLTNKKIATMTELKEFLKTNSSMTVFRKLKELDYISSCSHSGKYYSLKNFAKFNEKGLWFYKKVLFSERGTLAKTIVSLIDDSIDGYTSLELEKLLTMKVNGPLLDLVRNKKISREKVNSIYVYFSNSYSLQKQQALHRKESLENYASINAPDILMNELKASLILFFSILNENQRRIFVGLESIKHGYGGDRLIANIFDIDEKTVARGRKELLEGEVISGSMKRRTGGGRKKIQKKKCAQ